MEEVYTVCHVKKLIMAELNVKRSTWHYHLGRIPAADKIYGGCPFYSASQIDLVRGYFRRLASTERKAKSAELATA